MKRRLSDFILKDLNKKIVLLAGPRQVGKTTLSKHLVKDYQYFNYDVDEHRLRLKEMSWDRSKSLIVLDELHKKPNWKRWLKGIYDTEGVQPRLLVTGSARLDIVKKTGDSLAGRFFQYRLFPFDLKEIKQCFPSSEWNEERAFQRLLALGGFPEPFLSKESDFYPRWRKSHLDIILRQDLLDLESVRNISGIETLISLLRSRVGSTISYSSLAKDLEVDSKTVKRWIGILENLYVIFKITPYHKNIARSLLKEPKIYFYDNGQVSGDEGAQLENLVACALWKELHFLQDTTGCDFQLNYIRNKEKKELDFAVVINSKTKLLVEVKWRDTHLSANFGIFSKYFPDTHKIQLVGQLKDEKTYPSGEEVRLASRWLSDFSLI